MVSAPVGVVADVGNSGNANHRFRFDIGEELLPHWRKEHEVLAMTKILLRDLQLSHQWSFLYFVEDWSIGFAWLEVERSVLRLENDIWTELPVERQKFRNSLLHPVFSFVLVAIDEASPHDYSSVRLQRVGKHVGTFGMASAVVARSRLSLAVCFHEESTKVGYSFVYLSCLVLPPFRYLGIQRVGGFQAAESHGRSEVHRQVGLYAIFAQNVGNDLHLINIFSR